MAVERGYPQEEGISKRPWDATIRVEPVAPETDQKRDFSEILYSFTEMKRDFSEILYSFTEMRREMRAMEERIIERIDQRIDELVERGNIETGAGEEEVIILRAISREQAKREVLDLFDEYKNLDHGDIAERLRLDLEQVVEVVGELEKEGKIEEAE